MYSRPYFGFHWIMSPNRPVVVTLILCGGRGKRLLPLTRYQAKSTLPFAGRFRLIDVPIANSLSAGFGRIYLLTQYLSSSVHRYIRRTYNSVTFEEDRFIRIDTVDQTFEHSGWYRGTADAVRHSIPRLRHHRPDHYLIMAADQVYRMDLAQMFRFHLESGADITVACTPVCRDEIYHMGTIRLDERGRIADFLEKPRPDDPRISSFAHPIASPQASGRTWARSGATSTPTSVWPNRRSHCPCLTKSIRSSAATCTCPPPGSGGTVRLVSPRTRTRAPRGTAERFRSVTG